MLPEHQFLSPLGRIDEYIAILQPDQDDDEGAVHLRQADAQRLGRWQSRGDRGGLCRGCGYRHKRDGFPSVQKWRLSAAKPASAFTERSVRSRGNICKGNGAVQIS